MNSRQPFPCLKDTNSILYPGSPNPLFPTATKTKCRSNPQSPSIPLEPAALQPATTIPEQAPTTYVTARPAIKLSIPSSSLAARILQHIPLRRLSATAELRGPSTPTPSWPFPSSLETTANPRAPYAKQPRCLALPAIQSRRQDRYRAIDGKGTACGAG